jgi:hypothetical protein
MTTRRFSWRPAAQPVTASLPVADRGVGLPGDEAVGLEEVAARTKPTTAAVTISAAKSSQSASRRLLL